MSLKPDSQGIATLPAKQSEDMSDIKLLPFIQQFKELPYGETMFIPLEYIKPSQRDDGRHGSNRNPISVYLHNRQFIILDGNHRYYAYKAQNKARVEIIKVRNPNYYY